MNQDNSNATFSFSINNDSKDIDIEFLKKEVGSKFPFYDVKFNKKTVVFFCNVDENTFEEKFEELRKSLSGKGYIPMFRKEMGEQVIYVIKKPKVKKKPIWINFLLLIATIFTTTLAGSLQWVSIHNQLWIEKASLTDVFAKSFTASYLFEGFLFFSLPLLAILGIHEMGHYFTSRRHNLDASLPFFIPVPPPFILGTFGALISTREPIPNRKALLDIGVSGPICGFLVAIPVTLMGLYFMQQNPIINVTESGGYVTFPLILQGISNFFTIPDNSLMHPTLFAGWVGLFLTAVNLLPIGQLDGGHISKALLKEKHKYASWAVIIFLLGMGFVYTGWLFFAIIVLFLIGTQHQPPLNELAPLDNRRILLGIIAFIIFILCFAPIPMST